MKNYTCDELQEISADYRDLAKRLLRTDYSQCDANLKRFMNYIENNELIMRFITEKNTIQYDIKKIKQERESWEPFQISPNENEEIALEYQMLKYACDNFDGDFTCLYGLIGYIHAKKSRNDNMRDFADHIISPFVDYISKFITKCYSQAKKDEGLKEEKVMGNTITATNSTILLGSPVAGDVTNTVSISINDFKQCLSIIEKIEKNIYELKDEYKEDFNEILGEVKLELQNSRNPKKSMLTALKSLASGTLKVTPLIIELIKLLS